MKAKLSLLQLVNWHRAQKGIMTEPNSITFLSSWTYLERNVPEEDFRAGKKGNIFHALESSPVHELWGPATRICNSAPPSWEMQGWVWVMITNRDDGNRLKMCCWHNIGVGEYCRIWISPYEPSQFSPVLRAQVKKTAGIPETSKGYVVRNSEEV